MTTYPTPLQERIARALDPSSWRLHDSGTFAPEHQASQAVIRRSMAEAAAVLPIIAAEVGKGRAAALRDAADSVHDNAASPYCLPCHRDDADLLHTIAAEYETGDSDEHR